MTATGPLVGVRVVELAGLAPAPFAAMMLADLGAEVLRIDRSTRIDRSDRSDRSAESTAAGPTSGPAGSVTDPLGRGRRSAAVDLKHPDGVATVLHLVEQADVLIEGFRPGVCERLGIGPAACLARNPRLVYARLTGWGQTGPMAQRAGHDIDYLALAGALAPLGPADRPPSPPLNYVADFGGGGMLAVVGILAALWERERSGQGQVIDAAMVDGVGLLTAFVRGLASSGQWSGRRESNLLDGGAPFYRSYACGDGRFVAVGALEPAFYSELLAGLGLDPSELPGQWERGRWPELTQRFAAVFASRSRSEWARIFAESDGCVVPVLDFDEVPEHPHARAREAYVDVGGELQPAPAPRFGRTPGAVRGPAPVPGADTRIVLAEWGIPDEEIVRLESAGVLGVPPAR